jgi:hypothetical protein
MVHLLHLSCSATVMSYACDHQLADCLYSNVYFPTPLPERITCPPALLQLTKQQGNGAEGVLANILRYLLPLAFCRKCDAHLLLWHALCAPVLSIAVKSSGPGRLVVGAASYKHYLQQLALHRWKTPL